MKLGLCLPQLGPHVTARSVREFAIRADRLGFDSLWAQEHIFYPLKPVGEQPGTTGDLWSELYRELLSPLELLTFVGAITKHIRIGASVLVTAYHRPVPLAKQAATIDVLTGGRFILGLGLGWSKDEFNLLETPYEKRGDRSTDFIKALRACWAPNPIEYDGKFFKIPLCETSPKPVQRDANGNHSIPILGGFWSKSGLQRVAEFCDQWQPAMHSVEEAATMGKSISEVAMRDFNRGPLKTILRVMAFPKLPGVVGTLSPGSLNTLYWIGTAEEMLPLLKQAKDAGIDEVTIDTNYFPQNPGEEGWIAQPEFFAPLLEESHR